MQRHIHSAVITRESGVIHYSTRGWWKIRGKQTKQKREAVMAVGALDPGVPYESRWAPYDRIHGPGQGQFP